MIQNCRYFPECGGCLYLDLDDKKYQEDKVIALKKTLSNLETPDIDFFWIGPSSRRKIILQIDDKNRVGFFAKSSKNLVEIDECFVSEKRISQIILPLKNFLKSFENNSIAQIQITLFDNVLNVIFAIKRELNFTQIQKITEFAKANKINASYSLKKETVPIYIIENNQIFVENFTLNNEKSSYITLDLSANIFIQATKKGLEKITKTLAYFIENNFKTRPKIIDIYAGFGIYSFAVSHLAKEVQAFEGDEEMTSLIVKNAAKNSLANKIIAKNRDLFFYPISYKELEKFDLVIINPPRNGATPQVKEIANSKIKNVIYVSCNPQSFVFDAAILLKSGFKIISITAIDQFYSTNHLELVVIMQKN